VSIDLSKQQFGRAIPFADFERLRREAPVFWYEPESYWVVSSYELVGALNKDPARFSSRGGPVPAGAENRGELTLLTMDPPEHTRMRGLVNDAFKPSRIRTREGTARELAEELVARFVAKRGGDFVTDVAMPFPLRVIGTMMGIAREDEPAILRRTNATIGGTDPEYAPASREAFAAIQRETAEYNEQLLREHEETPRGDLIDDVLDARLDGEPLQRAQQQAFVSTYIGGGAETTRHLLAHGLLALLRHPDEAAKLKQGADITTAVEEMLRFTTPILHHARWPVETVEVAGQRIEPGQRTTLWMVSANRDEAVFSEPNRFDVTRSPNPHDALGPGGPHYCLGAGLARMEARVLFEAMLPHLDRIELAGEPERGQSTMFNILKHLPLRLR
jgi:cytochrome P450